MTVAWALLSTARINRRLIPALKRSRAAELVAVASRDRSRAERYARDNDIPRAYGSYEELLGDDDVEVVYIPLPNSMHVEWSIRALESGKHVLCEKPLARRAASVEEAFDVAERCDRLLMEAFMYRHNPQTSTLKRLVDEGAIGRPRLIRAAFSFSIEDPGNVRLVASLDGGSLMDVGCYCVSGARYLCGEPESVYGEQVTDNGVDVVFSGMLRFGGDVIATFDSGFRSSLRDELEVVGEEASLFVDDPWVCRTTGIELRRGDDRELIEIEREDSYGLQVDNFSRAIRGEQEPLLGRADAVGQGRALEELYRSADEGRPVAVGG